MLNFTAAWTKYTSGCVSICCLLFFGHQIGQGELRQVQDKVDAVQEAPRPKTKMEIKMIFFLWVFVYIFVLIFLLGSEKVTLTDHFEII